MSAVSPGSSVPGYGADQDMRFRECYWNDFVVIYLGGMTKWWDSGELSDHNYDLGTRLTDHFEVVERTNNKVSTAIRFQRCNARQYCARYQRY